MIKSRLKLDPKTDHLTQSDNVTRIRRVYIGAVSRFIGTALREQERTGLSPHRLRILDWLIAPKTLPVTSLDPETNRHISEALERSIYWHGTGRYQYQDGVVVDVLGRIAQHRELRPAPDPFDASGQMNSISLARARIYARAYADLHRNATAPSERYGSSVFWSVVFLSDSVLEAAREEGSLRRVIKRLEQSGKDEWHTKVNGQPLSVFASFAVGSDIPGNYPMLFGLSSAVGLPISRALALHEVRSGKPISLDSQITYLEVPRSHIAETKALLVAHNLALPVYALEDFERHFATMPVSVLMSPYVHDTQKPSK